MNIRNLYLLFFAGAASLVIISACVKHKAMLFVGDCDPAKTYYSKDVAPIINSNCAMSGCHDAKTAAEGVDLSSYYGVMQLVNAGDPTGSELIKIVQSSSKKRMPPKGQDPLTSQQIATISKWIQEGALNELCNSGNSCDTSAVTYTSTIAPIMQNNCTGCHSASNPSGGIQLTAYSGVAAIAGNGKLVGSVNFAPGFSSMPQNGSQLNACDRKKIAIWVAHGYPNN